MAQTSPQVDHLRAVPGLREHLVALRERALAAGVFADARIEEGEARLACGAKEAAEPAEYRVGLEDGRMWVSLVTPNRWLSQSIEADLVNTGDKLEDLIEEELVDQGFTGDKLPFEHFRSTDKLFTFRSPLPVPLSELASASSVDRSMQCLLAYEACFRRLGDMEVGDEE